MTTSPASVTSKALRLMQGAIDMDTSERRRGIQSMEVGLRVLEALVALGEPSALGAIAQRCGLPSPQTHRYLASLVASGMAQQDAASARYDVGPAALRLGLGALARIDPFHIADTTIADFVRRSGRSAQIAALGPMGPTLIRWWGGRRVTMTSCSLGSVLPLITSATGQIFLGFAPEHEIAVLLDEELRQTGLSRDMAETLRQSVRVQGHACVEGTLHMDLRAVAFPVFDMQARPVFSVAMVAPSSIATADEDDATAELGALCREISIKLGYPGDGG